MTILCVCVCILNHMSSYQEYLEAVSGFFYSSITKEVLTQVSKNWGEGIIHIELHDLLIAFYPKITNASSQKQGQGKN